MFCQPLGKKSYLIITSFFQFYGVQRNRDHHIYGVCKSIFNQYLPEPITQKRAYLGLISVFQLMNQVLNDTIFGIKQQRRSLFNVGSSIKYTINCIFFVKTVFGKWQLVPTKGTQHLLSSI